MDQIALNVDSWQLVIPEGLHDTLYRHLFPGDHDEHGAVVAAGMSRTSDGRVRLLARSVHLAVDGVDFVPGKRGYRMLKGSFVRDRILECRDERLVYLSVHNHGAGNAVSFSGDDLRSHERGYPALLDIVDGLPVGALVFATNAIAGDIWLPDGRRVEIQETHIIGRRRRRITPAPCPILGIANPRFDRQVRIFGDVGQVVLGRSKVAIIGLGGVGSLLAEYLAHLGVGYFILIDPDRIEDTNLPRVVYATRWDARTWFTGTPWPEWVRKLARRLAAPKVNISARLIRRINKRAKVEALCRDMLEPDAAAKLRDCDYIFLAADSMRARLLFNAIVHQYLIPGVQVGSKVVHDEKSGEITGVHSIVRPVKPDCGCLWCNQLINRSKLQEEAQTERERRAQRYVEDADVAAPSVITLNAIGASQATNDFMFYMTGLTSEDASTSYMRFDPTKRGAYLDKPRRSFDCTECGSRSGGRLARGDLGKRLPTFQE